MKQTLRRWRHKYKVGIGRIAPRETEPLALTQQKVGTSTPRGKGLARNGKLAWWKMNQRFAGGPKMGVTL